MISKFDQAKKSGILHLSQLKLSQIPSQIFSMDQLYRLDLGFNCISHLPDEISLLSKLEYLWINNNPITLLPSGIHLCKNLHEIDISNTLIESLPCEIGRLENLFSIVIEGTPMKDKLRNAPEGILVYLREKDKRNQLEMMLQKKLCEGIYRDLADKDMANIRKIIKQVLMEFKDHDDARNVIRHSDRLFPEKIHLVNAQKIKTNFFQIKMENDKKKLQVELELKIRRIYFDQMDPQSVEEIVKNIYQEITEYSDILFLIKHGATLFPSNPLDIDPIRLHAKLINFQAQVASERLHAIQSLLLAISNYYHDQTEPEKMKQLVDAVALLFKKDDDIKSLAADVSHYFPEHFAEIDPQAIRNTFIQEKKNRVE